MPLGNADVEGAVGQRVHHDVHRTARGHGGCDAHDLGILLCQFEQCLAKHILEPRRALRRGLTHVETFARVFVKLARCVPDSRILLGWLVAFTLHRVDV